MTRASFTDTTRKIQETTMVDRESVDFMKKLQDKMAGRAKLEGSQTTTDVKAMESILKNLNESLDVAVDKSYDEPTVDNALLSKSDKGLDFGDFRVDIKKEQWGKRTKNWYSIVETDGTVIAKDLALFESVMGIANALLQERDSDVAWFKNADAQYVSKLSECQHYKIMTAKATEDFKIDLYETKFQINKDRAIQQRQLIRERVWK